MYRWLPFIFLSIVLIAIASLMAMLVSYVGSNMYGDWKLVFQQLQSQSRWLTLSVACAVAIVLIAKLHEYERKLVSPTLGTSLLALRMFLILIIFLTLLEPVWTWSYDKETLGRVVVALDVSESMETRDQHAALSEKLRWAKSLGMFGKKGSKGDVDEWIRRLESKEEPEWISEEEEPNPQRREQRSQTRRKDIEASVETVADYSRLELAAKVLSASKESVLDQLSENAQTELAIFATDETRVDREIFNEILAGGEIKVQRGTSDLSQAVNTAIQSDSEIPLAGVVLISDGRDTSKLDQKKFQQRLSGLGVPVHTVLVGSEYRPRDLAISHLDVPETVFEDDSSIVKSIVHAYGFEDQEVTVFLEDIDSPDREPLKKIFTVEKTETEVAFNLDNLDLGRHRFRVRTEIKDRELRDDNNSREFSINVVDGTAHVLILEGEGRWEFRYLRAALSRDKRVTLDEVLFEQPFLGILDAPFFDSQLSQLPPVEGDATQFANYDCVIIGDVSPRHLTLAHWRNLERYVRDEGGTLVMTAGKRDFPLSYRGTIVNSLLPIENLRTIDLQGENQMLPPAQRGFHFSITPDGEQMAMFQLGDDWNQSRQIWSQLPGHTWGILGQAKGAATVYAAALNPGERPSLELERENALVVQHYVGNGQVLWLGVDSTWRWRFRVGDLYHHRFWGQLIRWAVGFKATAATEHVRLGLSRSVINEGEVTKIQARWNDRFLAQHPNLKSVAVIRSTDGTDFRKRVDLKAAENQPFMHEADVSDLLPGEYLVTLETPGIEWAKKSPETVLIVREELSEELTDVSAFRELLVEISEASGGRFFFLDEVAELPELFVGTQDVTSLREEIPLWSHWIVLAIFCCIAMTEWVVRKVNGLP
ncbi:vWA domain-containing protein [Thalassoglobus polymorphus]|nr:vWA domain-containing protein [Thalassoglobus polymorphus]